MPRSQVTIPLEERLEQASDALAETIFRYMPKEGDGISVFRTPSPFTLWLDTPACRTLHYRYYRTVWQMMLQTHLPSWIYYKETGQWLAMGAF